LLSLVKYIPSTSIDIHSCVIDDLITFPLVFTHTTGMAHLISLGYGCVKLLVENLIIIWILHLDTFVIFMS